jgi:hypothetical protein
MIRGDDTGAVLDIVRLLKQYAWNPEWLDIAAVEAIRKRDAHGFVEGFSCDHGDAERWLKENTL